MRSFLTLHPDNPITETGVRSELSHHGIASRVGRKRADLSHQPLDPLIVAGPWVIAAAAAYVALRALASAGAVDPGSARRRSKLGRRR